MNSGALSQLMLYKYRYWAGYTLLALVAGVFFLWQLGAIGPGIADGAKTSSLISTQWTWTTWQTGLQIVDLPYVLLQKASIFLFGLSPFAIVLPSALVGLLSCLLFFLLMQRLHKPYVAIIASALFIAASWHIALGRTGTSVAMIPFIWLLVTYSFMRVGHGDEPVLIWTALAAIAAALALYTPYGVYAVATCLLITLVHPEVRRRARVLNVPQIALGCIIMSPLLIPLIWGAYKNPTQLWELAGLTSQLPSLGDFMHNALETIRALVWHAPYMPSLRLGNVPLLDIGTTALLAAGIYRVVADISSMRSQFILCGTLIVSIAICLNPGQKTYAVLVLPVYLLVAAGVTVLFREWYKLFPRNPYARSFGLIPIMVLLGFIMSYHYQRYFVAWASAPPTYQAYNDDLSLIQHKLAAYPSLVLAVEEKDLAFYKQLETTNPRISVTSTPEVLPGRALLSSASLPRPPVDPATQTLAPVTNDDGQGALRFWLNSPINR